MKSLVAAAVLLACDPASGGTLAGIDISGERVIAEEQILAAVPIKTGEALAVTDLARVENAISDLGSFSKVTALIAKDEASNDCRLQITVEEHTVVSAVELIGVTAFKHEDVRQKLVTRVGEIPNVQTVKQDAETLRDLYRTAGYDSARVVEVDLTDGRVSFQVDEGKIIRIEVRGAHRTGRRRVIELLGIKEGDPYNSLALHKSQRRLYRTGLFALIGFGAEPVGPDKQPEGIALTVRVQEFRAPSFRAEFKTNQSVTLLSAWQEERNLRRGHRLRMWSDFDVAAPSDFVGTGIDDFYHVQLGGAFRQFRPPWRPYSAVISAEYERTKGRQRPDLGIRYSLDAPFTTLTVAFPIGRNAEAGVGGHLGWFQHQNFEAGQPRVIETGAFGRVQLESEWKVAKGLETPGRVKVKTGVELTEAHDPFGYLVVTGQYGFGLPYGSAILDGSTGVLGGAQVPFWRDFRLGGRVGPDGFARDFAFTRRYLLGGLTYEAPVWRDLVVASGSWQGLVFGDGEFRNSAALRAAFGPEFLRGSAGVVVPLDGSQDVWWTLELVLGTPF